MKVEVLISCMHQKDGKALAERTNIQGDALIINQCDEDSELSYINTWGGKIRVINTTERGLSRSRNMAVQNAIGDICLICDDDENLEDNYEETIKQAFIQYPDCDIIAFKLNHPRKTFPGKAFRVGYYQAARIGSIQIAFKKCNLVTKSPFCEIMGSGSGNGGGEENKFLVDCLRKGAKIMYVPSLIASVAQSDSQWFHGYTEKYWVDRGWTAKMIYGKWYAIPYLFYTLFFRAKQYDKTHSVFQIAKWIFKGAREER